RFTGRTERELAWRLDSLFHELGAVGPAFETIVASGPNGASPHSRPTDRVLGLGETVVVDAGARVDGYCSDCTRTFATGLLPEQLREAYAACLDGQLAGLGAVRAGVTGVDADAAGRDSIEAAGFGAQFGHGLGHGVGLEVHEAPRLSRESPDTLVAGNVATVKPGKGGAFVRSKLRNLDSGAVVDKTFRAGEKFTRVHTEVKPMQYLYDSGDEVVFMDTENYEQVSLPHATVEDALPYMEPSST